MLATAIDFLILIIMVQLLELWYIAASVTGTVCGGLLSFALNRKWVFGAESGSICLQFSRYSLVWFGNLLLVTLGVYLMTSLMHLNYLLSKTLVSILLGVSYNYLLQKQFIFSFK